MGYRANGTLEGLFDAAPLGVAVEETAYRVQLRLLRYVVKYTPVDHSRGFRDGVPHLADTWETPAPKQMSRGIVRVEVLSRDERAPHVEYPTRPHLIRPRRDRAPASVLSTGFARGDSSDETPRPALRLAPGVYRYVVEHPGTQGTFMMHRAIEHIRREWKKIGAQELERAFRRRRAVT